MGGLIDWQRGNYDNSNSLGRHGSVTHSEWKKLKNTRLDTNAMVKSRIRLHCFQRQLLTTMLQLVTELPFVAFPFLSMLI
jgi:hypothetical protein